VHVLVTGGAGYIGSHTAKALSQAGFQPVVFDNLSTGHAWAVKWGPLIEADLCDPRAIRQVIQEYRVSSAIHFAAHAYVDESMREPRMYFHNNVQNTLLLLDSMLSCGVKRLVFSSSCAVYGVPQATPIREDASLRPVNPYGESKLFIERVLEWYGHAYNLRSAALRYFNAAGADPDGEIGEVHDPETHLMPLVIEAALGTRQRVDVFGDDYSTEDGTAVRDYVHVSDLANAHVLALQHLMSRDESFAVNLGIGRGFSVRQIINAVSRVAGVDVPFRYRPRRPGDPPELIADPGRATDMLHWHPKFSDIDSIVSTAWRWHQNRLLAHPGTLDSRARQARVGS